MSSPLLEPFQLGPLALKNRLVMAPMTRNRAGEGRVPTPLMAEYYAQRASAGLIITEATQISQRGTGYVGTPGIHTPDQIAGWKTVTDAVHAAGGHIFCQIWHVGRISHAEFQPSNAAPLAPSAIRATKQATIFTSQGPTEPSEPRAMSQEEIRETIEEFAQAARNAREAGFDGVEIHAANGYLIDQFLRSGSNQRTDAYGGSLENRLRFLSEVVQAVVAAWRADRVGVRLSPMKEGFNDVFDENHEETFSAAVQALNAYNLAYVHLFDGLSDSDDENAKRLAPKLRVVYTGTLIVNGNYDQAAGEADLAAKRADLIAYGQLFLSNPDLPERFRTGAALNTPDHSTYYGGTEKGYTDYPTLTANVA